MSIDSLEYELGQRTGEDLLPGRLPIDVLISMTRELSLGWTNLQSSEDWRRLSNLSLRYFKQVAQLAGEKELKHFNLHRANLMESLGVELEQCLYKEIVSRTLAYDVRGAEMLTRAKALLSASIAKAQVEMR